ncbi:MAG TPA: zinc ribbon domain-containing protein [Gemmatimonadales bacterium]|nr:zinc ribbon domain-containing protein [Gemmatimonadales bacterium]
MPTYEYKCRAGHSFEKFYPTMNDRRRAKCPTCGRQAERQISGGTGLVFKGSGFYTTDYKRAGEKTEKAEGESKPAESKKPTESQATESKSGDGSKKKKDSGDK